VYRQQLVQKTLRENELRVRQILAEEIKALDCVPKEVVRRLARDVEKVAAPILEFSPLLSDADLIEILTTAHANCKILRQPQSHHHSRRLRIFCHPDAHGCMHDEDTVPGRGHQIRKRCRMLQQ